MKQKPVYSTVKVGLLTLVALSILVSAVIWLRGRGVTSGETIRVYFNDVDGMRPGAPVQYMGMRVGFIEELKPMALKDGLYKVLVQFVINEPSVEIPEGSILNIQQSGFIGEKFMEITPPRIHTILYRDARQLPELQRGVPVMAEFKDGLAQIGEVREIHRSRVVDLSNPDAPYVYKVSYWITKSGLKVPDKLNVVAVKNAAGQLQLVSTNAQFLLVNQPRKAARFGIEEPLRIKDFLEKQLASAEALQQTNEKINTLMSEDTIESIQATIKNTEQLTVRANKVLEHGDQLFVSARQDLKTIVSSADELSTSITALSKNVNAIAGDPQFQSDLKKTLANVEHSTSVLKSAIEGSDIQAIVKNTEVTSENAAVVMTRLRRAMVEEQLPEKVDKAVTELNKSLDSLSFILGQVEGVSEDDKKVGQIVSNVQKTSNNLRKFSEKLNKHFLIFRLLF